MDGIPRKQRANCFPLDYHLLPEFAFLPSGPNNVIFNVQALTIVSFQANSIVC